MLSYSDCLAPNICFGVSPLSAAIPLTLDATAASRGLLDRAARYVDSTPALVIELAAVERAYRSFTEAFTGSPVFYALKANPDPRVARRLASLGCGFEIASATELGLLAEIGVEPERVISSNPIKAPAFVAAAHEYGVRHFGFDSDVEIDKLARYAPGCEVSVRLVVPNEGSDWPLDKKFGAAPAEAAGLMRRAARRGLIPAGVTFHVGSQCRRPESWAAALDIAGGVLAELARDGIEPRVVNVGGGMPVAYASGPAPSANDVASVVKASAARLPWPVEIWLEPGRGLVGEAGTLVTEVIGVAEREGRRWVYLDVGIFHGLAEAMGGIAYRFETDAGGAPSPCTIAGPSCDSVDVITTDGLLPEITVGDRVVIPCAGAYTTAYASAFNGFPGPETIVVEAL